MMENMEEKSVIHHQNTEMENMKAPQKRKSKNNSALEGTSMSYELQQGYRILHELMSDSHQGMNQPFMNKIEDSKSLNTSDYYRVIKKPMWLSKIKEKFSTYKNITEVIKDLRLMLENCYRYNGPENPISKKGVKLEMLMEQKLALLSRDLREKTSLKMTYGNDFVELKGAQLKSINLGGGEMSLILYQVRNEKTLRSREVRKMQIQEKKAEKQGKDKGAIEWEKNLLKEPILTEIKSSWELPQIGHFLYLCQRTLNIPEVPQFELERILMMPQEAGLLARIMTSLFSSPHQRIHLDKKRAMSYHIWTEKLKNKVQTFYKCYQSKNKDGQAVFEQIGIEPLFFKILSENNPLEEKLFHELDFSQRIWLLKSICDYTLHNHQTVKDDIANQPFVDQRDYTLGTDEEGNRYLHFPQFCGQDLRIYRQSKWTAPKIHIPAAVIKLEKQRRIKRKLRMNNKLQKRKVTVQRNGKQQNSSISFTQTARPSRLRQLIKPVVKLNSPDSTNNAESSEIESDSSFSDNESEYESAELKTENFELIVDSVESLRKLVEKFSEKKAKWMKNRNHNNGTSPKKPKEVTLYERLRNLLLELEPWESKLQQATKRLRNKLYKEWLDFQNRQRNIEKDKIEKDKIEEDNAEEWSSSDEGQIETNDIEEKKMENDYLSSASDGEEEVKAKKRKLDETSDDEKINKLNENTTNTKLPNGAAKGLLLSHQKQNTASQAKELYEWETLRQILVSPQKESESETVIESTLKKVNFSESVRNLTNVVRTNEKFDSQQSFDSNQEQSLVSRRQSTLSIRLPNIELNLESPSPRSDVATPSPSGFRHQLTPSTPRTSSPSTKQILTLAQNSGMPKILADKIGPDAQFMHFHLGSPTTKKMAAKSPNFETPKTITNSSSVESPKLINNSKDALDNQKLLLIPAVTAKGDRVYLKLAVSNNNCNNNTNQQLITTHGSPSCAPKSPIQLLGQPPPLAPIGSKSKSKDNKSPVQVNPIKLLGQPPPLAQIGHRRSSNNSPSSPFKSVAGLQTVVIVDNGRNSTSQCHSLSSPTSSLSNNNSQPQQTLVLIKASETSPESVASNSLVSTKCSTVTTTILSDVSKENTSKD